MTYTDIDKQVDELNLCGCSRVCFGHDKQRSEVRKLAHQLYSQAKAEQREEDALIAEGKKINDQRPKLLIPENSKSRYGSTMYDAACDSIASEIRGQHECKQTTQESLQVKE